MEQGGFAGTVLPDKEVDTVAYCARYVADRIGIPAIFVTGVFQMLS